MTPSAEPGSRPPRLGRYELITRIGQGGMAEVQLALQRGPAGFEKLVVVKLVHENLASQKAFVDMLLDEARVAALVKHPNVVDIYDLGEVAGRYFIAMEYLEGEPLLAVLRAGRDGKRLDVLSTARLIADTAEGLDAAHELRSMAGDPIELVHHDVSLGNIVVLYNGQVKLVDFGVAKASQSASARKRLQGKFSYMAPEKLRGGVGDRRSDIWSLGCVLWEALTLTRLFRGGNDGDTMQLVLDSAILAPSKVNGDVPADFDPIVLRSLERNPDKRYPTAKAMAADLEGVLRKHGYAAKNDMIATYMQATFHGHIAARKKLLQEVSSKGGASADVLQAAFNDASKPDDGAALAVPRGTPEEGAPVARGTGDEATDIEEPRIAQHTRRRRWAQLAAGVSVIAAGAIAVGVVVLGGSEAHSPSAASATWFFEEPRPARTPAPAPAEAATRTAPEPLAAPIAREPSPAPAAHEPGPTAAIAPRPAPPKRPPPAHATAASKPPERINPDEVYKTGVQAWAFGDTRTALALYRRVLQASPNYAPAWRGVGLAYETLGDRASARSAFHKYLQLSPGAADAAGIRAKLEAP